MPITDFKKWLSTECPKDEIKYLDTENKVGAYIPIGLIEQNLDEFDNWGTTDFSFLLTRVDKNWVASGSVSLNVEFEGKIISRHGAVTFPVQTKSTNDDYESTALSLAIANAAKKLGKRFGRHLNGRLEKGEALPEIDLEAQRKLDFAIDAINESKSEEEIKKLYDENVQYQKNREYITAISTQKQLLKILKDKSNGQ